MVHEHTDAKTTVSPKREPLKEMPSRLLAQFPVWGQVYSSERPPWSVHPV